MKALRDIQTIQDRELRPGYTVEQGIAWLDEYERKMAEDNAALQAGERAQETLLGFPIVQADLLSEDERLQLDRMSVAEAYGVPPVVLDSEHPMSVSELAEALEERPVYGESASDPMPTVLEPKQSPNGLSASLSAMRQGLPISPTAHLYHPLYATRLNQDIVHPDYSKDKAEKKAKAAHKTEKASRKRNNKSKPTNKANRRNKK